MNRDVDAGNHDDTALFASCAVDAWPAQRELWRGRIVAALYGDLPSPPRATRVTLLHRAQSRRFHGATFESWRIDCFDDDGAFSGVSFCMQRLIPDQSAISTTIISGDACWTYLGDEVRAAAIERGIVLAWFNRTELAADPPDGRTAVRSTAIFSREPSANFGAIACWAWGFHRVVDALAQIAPASLQCIAVTGHSRGGKAALLAGATDARITLTHANNSGIGGAANRCNASPASETLSGLVSTFPHWLARNWARQPDAIEQLSFDQQHLLALFAPRQLLITQADGDTWANPAGTRAAVAWARDHLLKRGVSPDAISMVTRVGDHPQTHADWLTLFYRATIAASKK